MTETGAIDLLKCSDWPRACKCESRCIICGFNKHFAVHGPRYGGLPGSEPYDHQYQPPIKSSCPGTDEVGAQMKAAAEAALARVAPEGRKEKS